MDKYIGRLLDNRYEILEIIGTGGMAVVYKARCHRLNRLVAIKILKDDYLEDEDFRRRFHSESQAVAMLSHPNIVSVYDVSTSIMADYIVMELIEGISLKQYMEKKGVLNWKETLHFALQIAKALEHAHSRGIVHRDIKPHNVMVLKNGSVKVTDFGIARMMSKGNTLTKEALGSVHYISPEQAKGGRVDNRSDIYSLGTVMYEMMAGRPPYDGDSPVAVAIQHINGGAVMPSTLNPNIPGGLEQIIMKSMAHEASGRYESATAMIRDMEEFRKDPTILFDYNTPPLDEVIKLRKAAVVPDIPSTPPKTVAERTANRPEPRRRTNADAAAARRRRQEEEERRNHIATVAIISCSIVAVLAIVIFLVVYFGNSQPEQPQLIQVPDLIGDYYDDLPEYDFDIRLDEERYDDKYKAGQIIEQYPEGGIEKEKGSTIYVTVSKGVKTAAMVKLENETEMDARNLLMELQLDLEIHPEKEYHDTIPEGNVIRSEPAEGATLTKGDKVTLILSMGPEPEVFLMPDLVEDTEEIARDILSDMQMEFDIDIKIEVEEEYHAEIPVGQIIRTDPEKDVELKDGQTVTLILSMGPEPQMAKMPKLIGWDMQSAVSILESKGFDNYDFEQVDSNEPKGQIVGQSHEPDAQVEVTEQIILQVSKGPQTPQDVTKDVVFELSGENLLPYTVEIRLGNTIVKRIEITEAKESITVSLTGTGTQTYELWIGGYKDSEKVVDFTANG